MISLLQLMNSPSGHRRGDGAFGRLIRKGAKVSKALATVCLPQINSAGPVVKLNCR